VSRAVGFEHFPWLASSTLFDFAVKTFDRIPAFVQRKRKACNTKNLVSGCMFLEWASAVLPLSLLLKNQNKGGSQIHE